MRARFSCAGLIACCTLLIAAQAQAIDYKYSTLPTLGGEYSFAGSINNAGQIIGTSHNSEGVPHATLWSGGTATDISPSYFLSRGNGINNSGQIVGNYQSFYGRFQVTRAYGSCCADLGTMGGSDSNAADINNHGVMVGTVSADQGWAGPPLYPFPFYGIHAAMWDGTNSIDLHPLGANFSAATAINDDGKIVGAVDSNAVVWSGGTMTSLGSGAAYDINNAGVIAGASGGNAVVWNGGTQTILGAGSAAALNITDQVVGTSNGHAFLWSQGLATDLNVYLTEKLKNAGWILESAVGINDAGWIVGTAFNTQSLVSNAFLLSPIPEPSTYAMLMLGIGFILWKTRRRGTAALAVA